MTLKRTLQIKLFKLIIVDDWYEAFIRYCVKCKKSFKTPGAKNAHHTLKHNRDKIKTVKQWQQEILTQTSKEEILKQ